jgi:hypothetical protein
MKLTVGPLPAAVYWRRRAVVLAGVLIVVLLTIYSCGTGSDPNPAGKDAKRSASPSPVIYPSDDASSEEPPADSGDPGVPADGSGPGAGSGSGSGSGSSTNAPPCADSDIAIVPKPAHTETPEGARLRINLEITNVSERACKRDIGADQQEVRLMRDDTRIWSSDDCHPQTGSQVEVLSPDETIQRFWVTWDGKTSAPKCEGTRKVVQEGSYDIVARLGNVVSKPVNLKVVG